MQRFVLHHESQRIVLPEGETLIGRGLSCRVRFNDPTVSREHLRVLVRDGQARATNLSQNGTLLNGKRLSEPTTLEDDDELQLGYRRIRVSVLLGASGEERADRRAPDDLLVDVADEMTRPGFDGWRERSSPGEENHEPVVPEPRANAPARQATPPARILVHTCPTCRAQVAYGEDVCPRCGYTWPAGHPSRTTQKIKVESVRPRKEARYRVEVPVVYSSSTLTIDAIVQDISRGGMFVATDVLDPVGTPCEITALPDGHPAMTFSGVVAHVSDDEVNPRASGLGIRIVGGDSEALRWLEHTLARFSEAIIDE